MTFRDLILNYSASAKTLRSFIAANNVDVNELIDGCTPLYLTIKRCGCAYDEALLNRMRVLLDAGANPSAYISNNNTKSHLLSAINRNRTDIAMLLIERGADPNEFTIDMPVLTLAAIYGMCYLVQALINAGANVNALNNRGYTAMMEVCLRGTNIKILELLLDAGADTELISISGHTALQYVELCMDEMYGDQMSGLEPELQAECIRQIRFKECAIALLHKYTRWNRRRHMLMFICDLDAHEAAGGHRIGGLHTRQCFDVFDLNRELLTYI